MSCLCFRKTKQLAEHEDTIHSGNIQWWDTTCRDADPNPLCGASAKPERNLLDPQAVGYQTPSLNEGLDYGSFSGSQPHHPHPTPPWWCSMFSQSSHVYVDVSHAEKRAPGHGCISTAWPVGAAHTEGDLAQGGSVNLRLVRWFTQEAETEVMTHVTEEWRRTDTQALKTHKTLQTQRCYRHTDTTDT